MKTYLKVGLGLLFVALMLACGLGGPDDTGPINTGEKVAAAPSPLATLSGTIGDGKWEVGPDIAAGSYTSPGASEDESLAYCYWIQTAKDGGIVATRATTKVSDRQLVKLKVGQSFETHGCTAWVKPVAK